VRIRSGDREVVASGEWRETGTVDVDRLLGDLGAVVGDGVIRVDVAGDVLFEFDSAEVQAAAAAKLAQIAQVIRSRSAGEVLVVGHTDGIGSQAYNMKLSRDRALAVIRWLHEEEGIPAAIMVGRGLGASRPVAPNALPDGSDNPTGRARNRRVEIQVATRAGVTLEPGVVSAGGVRVDEGGVTVGGVRIEAEVGEAAAAVAGNVTCAALCGATSGSHSMSVIGCLEGAFEELGYELDTDSCDELEDAMVLGFGNSGGSLCLACAREQGFTDADCAAVAARCFPGLE
jgi:outer membrane protein OmpA-like peptidoglycan-associated protein